MARLSNKHGQRAQQIFYGSFDGGLNLAVPPESLPRNELKEAKNVEFSPLTGALRVRGGLLWAGSFPYQLDDVVPFRGHDGFLVRVRNVRAAYFFRWNNIWSVYGAVSGGEKMSSALWVDSDGNECLLVASGGVLQKFIDNGTPTLKVVPNAPEKCRFVFVRDGRVGVVDGDDTLRFSAVGDCESWENDPNDESSGQFVEIGYKDGMNINAVIPLSKDLIIFKSPDGEPDKGTIFRLTGDFPDWQVLEVAHNTGTFSQSSVQAVGNDVFYVTTSGVASLSSVTQYGEIKTSWIDRKVSNALTKEITGSAQLWDVPVKQQLWLSPDKEASLLWVFDYTRGIWTQFDFPKPIIHAAGVDNRLFLFIGSDLYELHDDYIQDEIHGEEPTTIEAHLKLGTLLAGRQVLVKGAYASFHIVPGCSAELLLGGFRMPFSIAGEQDYIFDDNDCAYDDDDPLFPEGGALTARRRCLVRGWAITPEIVIKGGGCELSTLGLEIAEV